jgi:hypothetical protein
LDFRRNVRTCGPLILRNIRKEKENMSGQSITEVFKEATGASIGWAVVMIVLGFVAVFMPFAAALESRFW